MSSPWRSEFRSETPQASSPPNIRDRNPGNAAQEVHHGQDLREPEVRGRIQVSPRGQALRFRRSRAPTAEWRRIWSSAAVKPVLLVVQCLFSRDDDCRRPEPHRYSRTDCQCRMMARPARFCTAGLSCTKTVAPPGKGDIGHEQFRNGSDRRQRRSRAH
jgi:hypothetical protein